MAPITPTLFIYGDSDDLYDVADRNSLCSADRPSTVHEGNFPISFTAPAMSPASSVLPTPTTPEANDTQTQAPGLSTMVITSITQGSLSTPPPPPKVPPLASISNNEEVGRGQTSSKRAQVVPAVVGKGLTDK
jgi:hypothetical protein